MIDPFIRVAGAPETAVHTVRPVKGVMLQAMLLAGLVAAPLGSLALFVPRPGGRAREQLGRPAGRAARLAAGPAYHRVPP